MLGCARGDFFHPSLKQLWQEWALSPIWASGLAHSPCQTSHPLLLAARGGRGSGERGRSAGRGSDHPCQRGARPWAGAHRGGGADSEGKGATLLHFGSTHEQLV